VAISDLKTSNGAGGGGCYDCSKVEFHVTVSNTGKVAGETPVLGFVETKTSAGVSVRSLFDFARVSLAPGASTTVALKMDAGCKQAISLVDEDGVRWMQPGDYTVKIGGGDSPATHALAVIGERAQLSGSCRN
jgi:hypothetical protein